MTAMTDATLHVLDALRSADDPCSGEALSGRLGVSRAQIWKHIERLRKRHERFSHRHQGRVGLGKGKASAGATSVEAWEGAPDTATREIPFDGTPIMIRSKVHAAAPMTVSEAIDRMELVGHDFYLFHDSESGLPSVVYCRRGWTYGGIHLEESVAATEDDQLRETA